MATRHFKIVLLFVFGLPLPGAAQQDKPNEKFSRVWDGGIATPAMRRGWEIEVGFDIDQDGRNEFAAYDADSKYAFIWESHGNGDNHYDLIWSKQYPARTGERSLFWSDLDNDGKGEFIVIWDPSDTTVAPMDIYEWDGTDNGIPQTPTLTYKPPRNSDRRTGLEVTSRLLNMDSDPEPEFVLTHRVGAGLYLSIFSLVNGDFTHPQWKVEYERRGTDEFVHGAGMGDIDNNGTMDIITSSEGEPGPMHLFTNTGDDTYEEVRVLTAAGGLPGDYIGCQSTIVITDLNGDGKNETYIFGQQGQIWLVSGVTDLRNIAPTNFTLLFTLNTEINYRGGVRGDLDNDGLPDLYATTNADNGILDLEWKGGIGGEVTNPANYEPYIIWLDQADLLEPTQCAIGDLDGDGPNHGDLVFCISPRVAQQPGIFLIEYDAVTTGVPTIQTGDKVPTEFALHQNFPNPFNPHTAIEYELPTDGFVVLSVYDLLGLEVQRLVGEQQKPGRYRVHFDAAGLPSGIYWYRLTVQGKSTSTRFVDTRKMLVLK